MTCMGVSSPKVSQAAHRRRRDMLVDHGSGSQVRKLGRASVGTAQLACVNEGDAAGCRRGCRLGGG
ncbi:hypothetical protein SAM23877_7391 [Streptomyces ambofaciens ATCC 23877]|uniref:Uncharacterized protein n=1 Tax=Streptomyces ambofaciens (strain ATCC 23877 / 3486 / DSM 40053 / JCM 4204 / NBRC 12836 / NRRL B-2516) TaxID=278992 RepID=A0A0K2B5V4_STRA7|nr:hypothetical protein SAM23877_7391 [Streptomyces ambofaciens ATCC 23877]